MVQPVVLNTDGHKKSSCDISWLIKPCGSQHFNELNHHDPVSCLSFTPEVGLDL